jgi:hypothetical protein
MNWFQLRNKIKSDIEALELKSPKTRLGGLDSIDGLIRTHFKDIAKDPAILKGINKELFKSQLAAKKNKSLNGAEENIVNHIYNKLNNPGD